MTNRTVLVTGATGYIGGRLVPALLDAGQRVRCLARTPSKLDDRSWRSEVEVIRGDVADPASLGPALAGVDAAYYLVHSMGSEHDFAERDRQAARAFRDAAAAAGLQQVIYLGGLGDERDPRLSAHLRSRHEVGRILAEGPVPVTELRAAVIIGSGSASFEMLRTLTEVLPAMVTPKWVETRCQPIAIRDVLAYLVGVLGLPGATGRVLEIGGPDVVTYRRMMEVYAEVSGLRRRLVVPVPVLSPRLSSLWVGLVTPLPADLARPLVDSLVNEVLVHDPAITRLLPRRLLGFREAVSLALARTRSLEVSTSWAGAELPGRDPADPLPTDPGWSGGTVLDDVRSVRSTARPHALYRVVTGVGGDRGWYVADWLWWIRGLVDRILGGPGMRRGRRHPDDLRVGDPVDFWRVEALVPDRLVRLRAEMKVPGSAWLEWTIRPVVGEPEVTVLQQRALFHPRGVWGRAYWYALVPFHGVIFRELARRLAAAAEALPPAGA
ncbi:MAG: SDR family oxidoreductase [Acidimicrobiales bacterium]|nr:SDR family oxidoreductase [Acidimicrobiales bacterium]